MAMYKTDLIITFKNIIIPSSSGYSLQSLGREFSE